VTLHHKNDPDRELILTVLSGEAPTAQKLTIPVPRKVS
jgi:hypothetical protein